MAKLLCQVAPTDGKPVTVTLEKHPLTILA